MESQFWITPKKAYDEGFDRSHQCRSRLILTSFMPSV